MNNNFRHLSKPYLVWLYALALFPVLIMAFLIFLDIEGISLSDATFTLVIFAFC